MTAKTEEHEPVQAMDLPLKPLDEEGFVLGIVRREREPRLGSFGNLSLKPLGIQESSLAEKVEEGQEGQTFVFRWRSWCVGGEGGQGEGVDPVEPVPCPGVDTDLLPVGQNTVASAHGEQITGQLVLVAR